MVRCYSAVACLLLYLTLPLEADVGFDVASIKVNATGGEVNNRPAEEMVRISPGSISMTNVTLVRCLMDAYGIYAFQVSAPAWMSSARYDIAAKTAGPSSREELRVMLRTLLAERFHLTFHHTQKELNVYSLIQGKRGYRLREAAQPGDKVMAMENGAIVFRNYSIADLIGALSNVPFRIDRPVRDATGFEGKYDFEVKIATDGAAMKHAFEGMLKGDGDGPSLIDLVQEQLGLQFKPERVSIDVLAVDGADRMPTAN